MLVAIALLWLLYSFFVERLAVKNFVFKNTQPHWVPQIIASED